MSVDVSLVCDGAAAGIVDSADLQTLHSLEIVGSLAEASGIWVLLVGDPRSLDRHAAKNLLLAAEHAGATLAMQGSAAETEVLTAEQLHARTGQLDVTGVLFDREWLQARVLLVDELADGVRTIPTSSLREIASAVLIPQRTFIAPAPTIVDESRAVVHAGPVGRLAGLAFAFARMLPLRRRVLIDVNSARPIDTAFASLHRGMSAHKPRVRIREIAKAERNGWRHAWHLGRDRWVITNERFISRLPKRQGQQQIVAICEQPLLRTGRDNPDWVLQPTSERRPSRSQVERWDLVVTSSPLATQVLRSSSGYVGPVLEGASVFADAMGEAALAPGLRERLGLQPEIPLVLCAVRTARTLVPIAELTTTFAGRLQLVVVTDDRSQIDARQAFDDAPAWCAAADLMLTDWSSLATVFAARKRPIIGFQPDALDMVRRRGSYVDTASVLPGPVVASTGELIETLERWLAMGDAALPEFAEHSVGFAVLGSQQTGGAVSRILSALDGA